jgi:hypothetical protein
MALVTLMADGCLLATDGFFKKTRMEKSTSLN